MVKKPIQPPPLDAYDNQNSSSDSQNDGDLDTSSPDDLYDEAQNNNSQEDVNDFVIVKEMR